MAYRAGHYERDLTLKAGRVSVCPKLKGAVFESNATGGARSQSRRRLSTCIWRASPRAEWTTSARRCGASECRHRPSIDCLTVLCCSYVV
jgi:hypothetical protein